MGSEVHRLERFVEASLQHGVSKKAVEQALTTAGWPAEQIKNVLGAFADIPFSVPVPNPRASLSSRDAFLYLVMFSALYFGAWNLGDLLFSLVNEFFPDPSINIWGFPYWDQQRWAASAIIITLPIFLFLSSHISRQIVKNPIKRLSPIRRWLTYLTLFMASTSLIGDTTTLVYNLLGGELTTRFLLKVIIVAILAGTAFGYYLIDLRKDEVE